MPDLLPASRLRPPVSQDTPSEGALRPFGLACSTVVLDEEITVVENHRYDQDRQMAVLSDGSLLVDSPLTATTNNTTITKVDNQEFTDVEPVD
ncbi:MULTISPECIES: putative ATP-grasp-modified RiPP [Actinoalloteichus]|nr:MULTISPECIES: putative ATP-grasp-modified RiPP [Actinoalloteichus]